MKFGAQKRVKKQIEFENGNIYDGEVLYSLPDGMGTMHYANGNKYVGKWWCGIKKGKGVFT